MKKNRRKSQKSNFASSPFATKAAEVNPKIRMATVEMTESMACEFTMEFLNDMYKEGGYLAMVQSMYGLVQRYDAVLSDAEKLGQDENMCRAVGASEIALTYIPEFRKELAKLEGQAN